MKKVRVLMSSTVPMGRNGITKVMLNLYHNIDHSRYSVDFLSISEIPNEFLDMFEGFNGKLSVVSRTIRHPFRFIYNYARACRGFDIVHVHGNSGTMALEMLAAWIARVPVRITHGHNSSCRHKIINWILRPVMNVFSNYKVACGKKAGIWLYKNKKHLVLDNGIYAEKYIFSKNIARDIRKELKVSDCIVIGHVGNFEHVKNHEFLLDLFAELVKCNSKEFHLLLLGDGILKEAMIKKAQELGILSRVHFLGTVSDVPTYLSAMDIMVMPSFYEGVPLTLIEGQASGLPCVVSDTVSKEVNVTGTIEFCSLGAGINHWASYISQLVSMRDLSDFDNRLEVSKKNIESIKTAGFDVISQAEKLQAYYIDGLNGA